MDPSDGASMAIELDVAARAVGELVSCADTTASASPALPWAAQAATAGIAVAVVPDGTCFSNSTVWGDWRGVCGGLGVSTEERTEIKTPHPPRNHHSKEEFQGAKSYEAERPGPKSQSRSWA